jgi:pimeloyl-ACP methyl ester carboxylesterase
VRRTTCLQAPSSLPHVSRTPSLSPPPHTDFIREVVGGEPAVLVGNSLGGYNALATAARHPELARCAANRRALRSMLDASAPCAPTQPSSRARRATQRNAAAACRGIVLLNAAGRFEEASDAAAAAAAAAQDAEAPSLWARLVNQGRCIPLLQDNLCMPAQRMYSDAALANCTANPARSFWGAVLLTLHPFPFPLCPHSAVSTSLKRTAVFASFVFTKQPARIRQVLNQVRCYKAGVNP